MCSRAWETMQLMHTKNNQICCVLAGNLQDPFGYCTPFYNIAWRTPEFGLRRHEVAQKLPGRGLQVRWLHKIACLWLRQDMKQRQARLVLLCERDGVGRRGGRFRTEIGGEQYARKFAAALGLRN